MVCNSLSLTLNTNVNKRKQGPHLLLRVRSYSSSQQEAMMSIYQCHCNQKAHPRLLKYANPI